MHPALEQSYTIKALIGQGGMSRVYLAEHKRLQTRWAVKEVSKHQGARFDFLAEANILKQLQHPMLPRIVDIFEDESCIYIVEDFVEGITLEHWLKEKHRADEGQARVWLAELCGVLSYLHSRPRPIIYRDMKPSNIMIQPDGSLKLIDFGIAREYKEDSQGDTTYIGTKGYAAPEQFGKAQTDERTDIYSLGVTLYHLVTGKSPYEPPYQFVPVRQLNAGLSHGIEYILGKCTQPEPEARYQTVPQLLHDLQHIYRFDRAYIRFRRIKRARAAVLAVMLAASVGLIAAGYGVLRQEEQAAAAAAHAAQVALEAQQAQAREDSYADLLAQAAGMLETGDAGSAVALCRQAGELFPNRPEPQRLESYSYYAAGDDERCLEAAERGLAQFPEDGDLMLMAASACFNLGEYSRAAELFYQGAQGTALSADNLRDYAVCLGRLGDIEGAEAALAQLDGLGASPQATAYVRGEVAYAQGQLEVAEGFFLAALSQADTDALIRRCYLSLAETYRDSGQHAKAIELIDQGLRLPQLSGNPVLGELLGAACYNLGIASGDSALLTRAGESFGQVIALGVQKEYLYVNAFTAWQAVGDYTSAGKVLADMKAVWPQSHMPYTLNAMLLIMQEGQKAESQRRYQAAYEEYQAALERVRPEDETTQLKQLEGLIEQLRAGNWLS